MFAHALCYFLFVQQFPIFTNSNYFNDFSVVKAVFTVSLNFPLGFATELFPNFLVASAPFSPVFRSSSSTSSDPYYLAPLGFQGTLIDLSGF